MLRLTSWDNKQTFEFELGQLKHVADAHGDPVNCQDGRVYEANVGGRDLILKVLLPKNPNDTSVLRTMRDLHQLAQEAKRARVEYADRLGRAVTFAQGTADSAHAGFSPGSVVFLHLMERVPGKQLADVADSLGEPFSPARRRLAKQFLKWMQFLQAKGIVHADIYPDNVHVDGPSDALDLYVLDFHGCGLVEAGRLKHRPCVFGKDTHWGLAPEFADVSPEQRPLASLDSDRWSAACLLFWLLLGTEPFNFLNVLGSTERAEIQRAAGRRWPPDAPLLRAQNPDKFAKFDAWLSMTVSESGVSAQAEAFLIAFARTMAAVPGSRPDLRQISSAVEAM